MTALPTRFQNYKQSLSQVLTQFLAEQKQEFRSVGSLSDEVWDHILQTSLAGKMIRGSLSVFIYELLKNDPQPGVQLGVAWELFNTGVLMHDDIIDQDRLRRGLPSTYAHYEKNASDAKWDNPTHFGVSMAICVGDICLFSVNNALSKIQTSQEILSGILKLFSRETIMTGFGEMKDTQETYDSRALSEAEIKAIMIEKTARYTFVLPMVSAAMLAGEAPTTLEIVSKLGDTLGILFQIKDDELGLFGTTSQIGKPAGSDIREAKQTFFYLYLKQRVEATDPVLKIFGKPEVTEAEIQKVQQSVISHGAKAKVDELVAELDQEAQTLIEMLPWSEDAKKSLHQLRQAQLHRTK